MWNKIVNPKTGRKVNLNSKMGKSILKNYIKQLGGAAGAAVPENCPICLEGMNPQEILIKCHNEELPNLSHLYHPACIARVENQECPLCRVQCDFVPNTIQGYAIFTDAFLPFMRGIINRFYNGDVLPQNNIIVDVDYADLPTIYFRLSSDDIGQDESNGTMESPYTFPLNPNDWDVSRVTNMEGMFAGARSFNHPIGGWNVSNVKNMSEMFEGATSFNQPIGEWDVSNVKYMRKMFHDATSFNQPIGGWVVSDVKNMVGMFMGATDFNQPIGGWDVSDVKDMSWMFRDAINFNQPIAGWDVSRVTDMANFNEGAALLVELPPFA